MLSQTKIIFSYCLNEGLPNHSTTISGTGGYRFSGFRRSKVSGSRASSHWDWGFKLVNLGIQVSEAWGIELLEVQVNESGGSSLLVQASWPENASQWTRGSGLGVSWSAVTFNGPDPLD